LCVGLGGCDFPIDPQRTALQAVVYWQPETDPGTLILSSRSPIAGLQPVDFPSVDPHTTVRDPDGTSSTVSDDLGTLPVLFIDEAGPDTPLVAVIPLDNVGLDRIEATLRLWRMLQGRPSASKGRLTAQRRQRLRRMLQAIDGHIDGASYRDIGKVLYGKSRIAAEVWKTSALRDSTISLVRDGRAMIDGGYRSLLRQRRRK